MIPSKLKVVELRAELSSRGLDTRGNKAALVERLEEALKGENPDAEGSFTREENQSSPTSAEQNEEIEPDQEERDLNEASQDRPESSDLSATESRLEVQPEQLKETEATAKAKPDISDKEEVMDQSGDFQTDVNKNSDQETKEGSDADVKPNIKEELHMETNQADKDTKDGEKDDSKDDVKDDRKRKHSGDRVTGKIMKEDEPTIDESAVTLSWYDSDLNLQIDKDNLLCGRPLSNAGFGYIWAGCRATYGFNQGKVCFQVKLKENCDISHLEDEPNPNVLRVGWSTLETSMQLGEEEYSYGYGGTGKISVNCKFLDYGKPFKVGDVVTAYLDMSNRNAVMSFSVNDEFFDVAWSVPLSNLEGKALFPHVLTKNIVFEINFGQMEEPWFQPQPGYAWAAHTPLDQRVRGSIAPASKAECEMIMMCGLPACGKTVWANKHSQENLEKRYNIIGTNALIDKMKVMGLPRKGNYSGRWDVLIDKCTKCLQKLMDLGCHRRRNFILDQTNVYPGAQRRKMRNFEGFVRKAVVIVPTDEEFKRRTIKRESEEGKDVPDSSVMEMKANFTLPDKNLFDEVIYTELDEEESKKMVDKYNKEAIDAGYKRNPPPGQNANPNKKFKSNNFRGQHTGRYDPFRRGSGQSRFSGRGMAPPPRSGGWHRGPPERPSPGGGWRPAERNMGGGYRSSAGSGGGGGMWRGGPRGGGGGGAGVGGPRSGMGMGGRGRGSGGGVGSMGRGGMGSRGREYGRRDMDGRGGMGGREMDVRGGMDGRGMDSRMMGRDMDGRGMGGRDMDRGMGRDMDRGMGGRDMGRGMSGRDMGGRGDMDRGDMRGPPQGQRRDNRMPQQSYDRRQVQQPDRTKAMVRSNMGSQGGGGSGQTGGTWNQWNHHQQQAVTPQQQMTHQQQTGWNQQQQQWGGSQQSQGSWPQQQQQQHSGSNQWNKQQSMQQQYQPQTYGGGYSTGSYQSAYPNWQQQQQYQQQYQQAYAGWGNQQQNMGGSMAMSQSAQQ